MHTEKGNLTIFIVSPRIRKNDCSKSTLESFYKRGGSDPLVYTVHAEKETKRTKMGDTAGERYKRIEDLEEFGEEGQRSKPEWRKVKV